MYLLMMPPMASLKCAALYPARRSYVALYSIRLEFSSSSRPYSQARPDLQGQPFTSSYETGQPTQGPLGDASRAPKITPKVLKQYLDKYVVGQERAKKMLSVAVYNQYQRIQEIQRQEDEERERIRKIARRNMHAVEEDCPNQGQTVAPEGAEVSEDTKPKYSSVYDTPSPLIEKSNIMVLGPSGVGKTLMIKMLAQILDVPFSMSDCTTFTQAGYIGEDADVSVQRLLAAADWDVSRAEYGIIYLDEVDKLATAKIVNGKDVSGEGVQQALLKIIEGTTLTITNKSERGTQRHAGSINYRAGFEQQNSMAPLHPPRPETYSIRTDNILFIFSGAFVGLQKIILDRVSRGSIGFGANIRSTSNSDNPITLPASDYKLFCKHRPFFSSTEVAVEEYNPLELASPVDFQKYGLIPEFIGRIPITTALSALTLQELIRILTEPQNSLVQQYTATFALSGAELYISTGALRIIAQEGLRMGTGARGLRAAMENLLWQSNYEVPGTGIRYILVTEKAALGEEEIHYWPRSGAMAFRRARDREEEAWREEQEKNEYEGATLEEFRKRVGSGRTQIGGQNFTRAMI